MTEFKQGDFSIGDRVKCNCSCNGEAIVLNFKNYYRRVLLKWVKGKYVGGKDTWEPNRGFSKIETEKGRQTLTQTIETEILRIKGGG